MTRLQSPSTSIRLSPQHHKTSSSTRRLRNPLCVGFVLLLGAALLNALLRSPMKYSARPNPREKVLFTVTTLSEYNNGRKNTVRGSDRFNSTLLPILTESVRSMLSKGYQVDVYLICGFVLRPERRRQLLHTLPEGVGLEIWDDALPLTYNMKYRHKKNPLQIIGDGAVISDHTRGLARQHRFVLKDKLFHYDLFVTFEDDELIKGDHVEHYLEMERHLYQLRQQAPKYSDQEHLYYGTLSQQQLRRTIPGFMRVEAVIDEQETPIPPLQVQVPVDRTQAAKVDPGPCCHVSPDLAHERLPTAPSAHQLITWETQIVALGVRQMPKLKNLTASSFHLDWVVPLRGQPPQHALRDYWSGNSPHSYYHNDTVHWRPAPGERKYQNNQGGYMATQRQLVEYHTQLCNGGFLPPFDAPTYGQLDGLDLRDVEYWSGGLQLTISNIGCGLRRIISLEPTQFSRQILYHTANNKQGEKQNVAERFTRLDEFYGMLRTVQTNAERQKFHYRANYTIEQHRDCNKKEWQRQKARNEEPTTVVVQEPVGRCLIE